MRVFILGNVALDETYAISSLPEAGVSIFGDQVSRDLGGKGCNQAIVMARCGITTTLTAMVGSDDRSETIRNALAIEPLQADLLIAEGVSSDVSIIFTTPDGENSVITTRAAAASFRPELVSCALTNAKSGDILVLQGNLSEPATLAAVQLARQKSMLTAFNPSPLQSWFPKLWDMIDIVFMNQSEALSLTGKTDHAAAKSLLKQGVGTAVITLGEAGSMLVTADTSLRVPSSPAPVIDTTGAGDCFMGVALASAILRKSPVDEQALKAAALASAVTVGRRGTYSAFPKAEELKKILTG